VLDCLAHHVPVIVNDEASYQDYPYDVVLKLPAEPSNSEIAAALTELCESAEQRGSLATRGQEYVRKHHDPVKCASLYAAAIHEFTQRAQLLKQSTVLSAIAPLAARCDDNTQAARAIANAVVGQPRQEFRKRRIYIDVSFIAADDHESGIQRVVKKIVHHTYTMDTPGVETVAIQLTDGGCTWPQIGSTRGLLHPSEVDSVTPERDVTFRPGDVPHAGFLVGTLPRVLSDIRAGAECRGHDCHSCLRSASNHVAP
jgi:hypothetical protein